MVDQMLDLVREDVETGPDFVDRTFLETRDLQDRAIWGGRRAIFRQRQRGGERRGGRGRSA